jgi:cell fate regulator YaaT (PSP1 superfamily)
LANDGSNDKKQPAPGSTTPGDRPKSRRRRRGRRSADNANPPGDKPPGDKPPKAAAEPKEGGQGGKSRSRRRGKPRRDKGEPRPREEKSAERSQTIPPPPKGESMPPAADAGEAKPKERRPRRAKREEGGRPRKNRPGRGGGGERPKEAKTPQAQRWSQAPPPASAERIAEHKPSLPPRKPGPPVFLGPTETEAALDEDIAIDLTPWEANVENSDGEGTLYNTVVVRGHRSMRSRLYDAGDNSFAKGEVVAIEGDGGGPGTGDVIQHNRRELFRGRLPRVLRRVHANEVSPEPRGKRREQEVFRIARHVASTLGLPIKIVRSQAEPSGKIVVFFASEERIDFRELYRRVSAAAQGRVELRQVGVRDAAKMLGGVAPCGLQLCCTSFLRDFAPVSIKMAKEQGLVLNPQRVSGLCGRLLCCLTYEDALYRTQRKLLPKLGKRVLTPRGPGKVRDVDVLSQSVRVALETGEIISVEPVDITPMFPSQRQGSESDGRGDGRDGRDGRGDGRDGRGDGRGDGRRGESRRRGERGDVAKSDGKDERRRQPEPRKREPEEAKREADRPREPVPHKPVPREPGTDGGSNEP